MAIIQPIIDLVEICALHGVTDAVLCPGSRSAAITISFVRNPKINCISVSDERSAGFIALGIVLKTKRPVVIVCTSGSAVYNFAPAVAEAFFQQIPLIVITADRPLEWIHQNDGQTIYQQNIYGENCKKSYNLLADFVHSDTNWYFQRTVNEAINYSAASPKGPVHLNIPIREPFYPQKGETYSQSENLNFVKFSSIDRKLNLNDAYGIIETVLSKRKIMIAIGQMPYNEELNGILSKFQTELNIPVIADVISNYRSNAISNHDFFLSLGNEGFKPSLLITIGQSFISKSFKKYFQKNKVEHHWHVQAGSKIIDPLQSINAIFDLDPIVFLNNLFEDIDNQQFKEGDFGFSGEFNQEFIEANLKAEKRKSDFLGSQGVFSELVAYSLALDSLPDECDLHLANSMAVRYANYLRFDSKKNIEVFANRGTSGIDGCLSTAVGAALNTDKQVYLFIGDMAFMYDRNALWNNFLPSNLRIIVFNNAGGGIFRLIDGPSQQPELEEFFETKQTFKAKASALEAGLEYYEAHDSEKMTEYLADFNKNNGKAKCLEVFSNNETNQKVFSEFMLFMKKI
jgi:2-succinyl-5-enolpyruvyl-6-hydroxy-3-cyclohexene-1-carboxylate synthase